MTRRRVLGLGLGVLGAGVAFGFGSSAGTGLTGGGAMAILFGDAGSKGRLTARPGGAKGGGATGLRQLGLEARRDGLLYVPAALAAGRPAPLLLMLHGAGGSAEHTAPVLQKLADEFGVILLVPDSRGATWDVIGGGYGPDVRYIDGALAQTFGRHAVDAARVAVGGFSDGASYALSLGITNGDLFTHVLAFSPGFVAAASKHGSPALFVSHGTRDRVLPIDVCSRRIVPQARREGYRVEYREFEGGHTVPPEIARGALEWFLKA
ncbi:MAG TPA: PHB depolymerase family esterase [Pyrinomonadaceae bacterium]